MLVQRPAAHWAYADDIPGTRCGPEDGPWPRPYKVLGESELWRALGERALPQSTELGGARRADSLNFQPCASARTQDRFVVRTLDIHGRPWTLTGVFDGHLGETTVEHVAFHLPIIVRDFLLRELKDDPPPTVAEISDLLARSIVAFDDAIAGDVLDLLPGGLAGLPALSDATIRDIINDQHRGGTNYKKARLCMYGTTALVALVDPQHEHLWVANVGDCQAVMVTPADAEEWKIEVLTTSHNGDNDAEVERVLREHPGEECVLDRRVLGALAPFRCLGDVPFKQPPEFSRRILYNLLPGFHDTSPWEEFLVRNQTPPYISAQPEITHRTLAPGDGGYLILASDGFADLCSSRGLTHVLRQWVRGLARGHKGGQSNMALRLLRQALGGDDRASVSRVLTLDMDVAWIDDTSLVVQTL